MTVAQTVPVERRSVFLERVGEAGAVRSGACRTIEGAFAALAGCVKSRRPAISVSLQSALVT